jgi:hypothetical protein
MCQVEQITHEVKNRITSTKVWPTVKVETEIPLHNCREHAEIIGILTALDNGERVSSHNLRRCMVCGSPLDPTCVPSSEHSANTIGQRWLKAGFDIKVIPTEAGDKLGFEPTLIRVASLIPTVS